MTRRHRKEKNIKQDKGGQRNGNKENRETSWKAETERNIMEGRDGEKHPERQRHVVASLVAI